MIADQNTEQRTIGNHIVGTEDAFGAVADCAGAMGRMFKDYLSALASAPEFDPSPSGDFKFERRLKDVIEYARQLLALCEYQEEVFQSFNDRQPPPARFLKEKEQFELLTRKSKIATKAKTVAAPKKRLSLPERIAATRRLPELKNLVHARNEFVKLRKALDVYVGLSGPKELKAAMYKALGVAPPIGPVNDTRKITVLVAKNPHRVGTKIHDRFTHYRSGMTVTEAYKAGIRASDIAMDTKHRYISIK
jgi:hypothetical protein